MPRWVVGSAIVSTLAVVALLLSRSAVPSTQVVVCAAVMLVGTVPASVWLRGRGTAAGAVAVVLTAPVVLATLAADPSDGVAVAGLLAGLPLLAIWATGRPRLLVRGLAGAALGLAVCAGAGAVPLVLGVLVAFAASGWSRHTGVRRARTRRVTADLVAVTAGLATTVLAAALLGWDVGLGVADQDPPGVIALLVPPVVVIAWAGLGRRRRGSAGEGDTVVVLGSALGWLGLLPLGGSFPLLLAGLSLTTALVLVGLLPARSAASDGGCIGDAGRAMLRG